MNNFDLADTLIPRAEECYQEAQQAFLRRSWNLTIRRAQEVVETSLKGVLKGLGVEYPKEHDVGGVFARICAEKGMEVAEGGLEEIKGLSGTLADWRSPAFYAEREYDEQQARWALEGAGRVLQLAREFLPRLKGEE